MAQNITFLGASYSNVPAVTLPKTGGGTASFTDVSDTTAVAGNVSQGTYFYTAAGVKTEGTATGGSMVIRDETDSHGGTIRHITAGTVVTGTKNITENGTHDVAAYADASVNVPTGTARSSSDLTVSGATVTVPAGLYSAQATKSVAAGTAGTPTATKGTVSNHSVSVTPSVTNSAGYISGGTKSGTAVTVSASELVSGTKSISENGTGIDVTNYASVDVAVPSGGGNTVTISGSGNQYDVFAQVNQTGTKHYTDGDTFTFQDGDEIYLYCSGSRGGGTIRVNGETVATASYDAVSYTLSPPNCSFTIAMSYGATSVLGVTIPVLSITSNGSYDVGDYGYANVEVPTTITGGDANDPIRFLDYDGAVVASYTSVPSSLPSVPAHTGLTGGTWNYTIQQVTTQFNAMGTCDVGANYTTSSGATEIDIELPPERLHPYLSLSVNGTVEIDWGDNSTPDTSTGTSLSTRKADIHHEYSQAGSYTIKVTKTSGTGYSLFGSSSYPLLNNNVNSQSANRVYSNCVKNVRVGANCSIGIYAFAYCTSLETVSLPSSVTSFSANAFYYCYALKHVTAPSVLDDIQGSGFYNCISLKSISLPSGITSIKSSSFTNCYSLESVSIPSGVSTVASSCFSSCYSLKAVKIPSGVTELGGQAFNSCYSLESVDLPSGLTTIGYQAFNSCRNLKSISLPSNVTTIGYQAFGDCNALESIGTLSGVTSIGYAAFRNCYSLKSITLPNNLTTINASSSSSTTYGCFQSCYSLANLTIPSGCTSFVQNEFKDCYGMAEYHFKATTPPTLANVNCFTNIQSNCKIYVPQASLANYQAAENWSTYASYMVGE